MAKLLQFLQRHPKCAFSEKVQRGDQGKFFTNHPRTSPRLKGIKALWRKWHYPLISMHLKWKDWKIFWRKQRLQKCPNGQVMVLFARSPKTRIFRKSTKGGTNGSFSKIAKKVAPFERPKNTLAQMALSSNWNALKLQRVEKILGEISGSKSARMAKLWQFLQGLPKPEFSQKVQKGGPREIFEKSPKK